MREIKFRVWNIDGYISLNKAIHDDIIVIQVPSSSNNSLIEVNWEGVELEQFTGCINKQDVEISPPIFSFKSWSLLSISDFV